ncbi:MAG TPA: hypothetical protein VGW10_13270, partial [Solirubrobacteraceae bacterium]|nr:hypothetical protein [Solirubrobacteraceae bacterium]
MRRLALFALLLAAAIPATAIAHPADEEAPATAPLHLLHLGSGSAFAPLDGAPAPTATPPKGRGLDQVAEPGPCTEAAKAGMPEGEGHDHQNVNHHRDLRCAIEQVAFLPLTKELEARPDVVLGEMDVKADVAAVSVIWPEGGILFFDVSDPAKPRFQSWYRSTQCEGAAIANNCGAFVDLTNDGKTAFIAQQTLTAAPAPDPGTVDPGTLPTTTPGIETVDVSDPENPTRTHILPVLSQGGVHTARSHTIPGKGTYVFGIANSIEANNGGGIDISKLDEENKVLVPISRINIGETHDTFIQNDPYDGKTYLYIAGGYSKGLLVYDISDPASPKRVAAWDLTPECTRDWYSHTVDVTHVNGRRIVTMPAEVFVSTNQSDAQKALGCGNVGGNGDQPGPLWILDATDFSRLSQTGDTRDQLKVKSEAALIATWTNPAGRAAGNLTFSPHNQQIVGDRIYLSDYHGGIYVLDASGAFAGRAERPRELGYIVPNGENSNEEARPLVGALSPAPDSAPRTRGRSSIWDMVFYKGHILAADQVGGFYSLRYTGVPAAPPAAETPPPAQATPPATPPAVTPPATRRTKLRFTRNRLRGGRLRLAVVGEGVRK